jgi:hypothetical protein
LRDIHLSNSHNSARGQLAPSSMNSAHRRLPSMDNYSDRAANAYREIFVCMIKRPQLGNVDQDVASFETRNGKRDDTICLLVTSAIGKN